MRPSATDSNSGQRVWARRQGLCRPGRRSVESETRTLARRGATPMPAYSHDHVADRHRIGARLGEATGGPIHTSGSVGASRRTSKRRCDVGPARTGTRQRSATAPAAICAAGQAPPRSIDGSPGAGRRRGPARRRAGCRRRTAPARWVPVPARRAADVPLRRRARATLTAADFIRSGIAWSQRDQAVYCTAYI